ncbi:cAMP-responsive element modulator isoform X1 [Fundulus heteroclitus]|uniref:cAMP-responsive element modulator isoform X1 n=1 Tax=Fundulus heteroclitus TaxID=8078 RepID=UPI00165A47E8|nr:cAMP-responsive element modulator isoform X1 [Fundulus heteroclitus]
MYQMNPEGNGQVFQQITENQQTGLFQAAPVAYVPNLQTSPVACFQMPQPPSGTAYPRYEEMFNYRQQYLIYSLPGSVAAGDLGNYHLRNPTSTSVKSEPGVGSNGSLKPLEVSLQKRELRLLKNREAARECRRKKKEYVRCLENRVAVLEQQNKTLIEELRALKDIYRHKAE